MCHVLFAKNLTKIRQIWPWWSLKHFTAAYRGFPPCTQSQHPIKRETEYSKLHTHTHTHTHTHPPLFGSFPNLGIRSSRNSDCIFSSSISTLVTRLPALLDLEPPRQRKRQWGGRGGFFWVCWCNWLGEFQELSVIFFGFLYFSIFPLKFLWFSHYLMQHCVGHTAWAPEGSKDEVKQARRAAQTSSFT